MRRRLVDSFDNEGGIAPPHGGSPPLRRGLTHEADGVIPVPRQFTEHRRQLQGARRERQLRDRHGDFRKAFGEALDVQDHDVGLMEVICRYCKALRFAAEPM